MISRERAREIARATGIEFERALTHSDFCDLAEADICDRTEGYYYWANGDYKTASEHCSIIMAKSVESGDVLGGYVYHNSKRSKQLIHIFTRYDLRRCGIATAMFARLSSQCDPHRPRIEAFVPERLTQCHLFLKRMGFWGTINKNGTVYRFVWRINSASVLDSLS